MSNKTTFKRLALAVVAALGFGVLSVAPSSATVTGLTVTGTAGAATTAQSDSSTTGTLSISWTQTEDKDSVVVTTFVRPIAATLSQFTANDFRIRLKDTTTSTGVVTVMETTTSGATLTMGATANIVESDSKLVVTRASGAGTVATNFSVYLDTTTVTPLAGTYTLAFVVTPYNNGVAGTPVVADVAITISKTATQTANESTVVDATKSIAILSTTANYGATTTTADSSLSVAATAATTNHAVILVRTFNAKDFAAAESVTATISGAGTLCSVVALTDASPTCGASLSLLGASGTETLTVRANGTAGVAKIDVKTTSKTFATKSLTFYATDPAKYVPSLDIPVIGIVSTSDVVSIAATDANGNVWGGSTLYLFSSDTAIASNATCSFVAADAVHYCAVTGVKNGETKWTIGNKSTLALSTVKSVEFAGPRVTDAAAASVKIEFDKAAYAPGEKARIYVTPLDAAGKGIAGSASLQNLLATGGITSSVAFSSGSDTLTAVNLPIAYASSATTGAKAGSAVYTVYMPFGKGTVTLTAKGGTALPAAGRVAVTASASVVDDSVDAAVDAAQEATDAAIAATDAAILAQEAADEAASAAIAAQETAQAAVDAVTALSAEVTKLVAQLATLQKLLNRVAKRVGVKL
jgi:hypothetical protein